MILSHNPEKEINGLITKRYGRKWIARRILQMLLAQIAFAILAFFIYMVTKEQGSPLASELLGVFMFSAFSLASIIRQGKNGKKEYFTAKIEWLKIITEELIKEREELNYGKLASLPWEQRIGTCRKMIRRIEDRLLVTNKKPAH